MTPARNPWTPDAVATLKKLWGKGMSAGQIGGVLHLSRCAVIGKVHRLKLTRKTKQPPKMRMPSGLRRRLSVTPSRPVAPRPITPDIAPEPFVAVIEAWAPLPNSEPTPLEEATGCRWPVGDAPVLFCNQPAGAGPYCAAHQSRAVKRRQP